MRIIYNGNSYNNDQIENDINKIRNAIADSHLGDNNNIVLHIYKNEYERAIGSIYSIRDQIPMFSIKSGGVPTWLYPYCHYKLEGLGETCEKIDGNQAVDVDGLQLTAVLGEKMDFLSLKEETILKYKQLISDSIFNYATVFIPENLINITFTLAVMAALDQNKDIIIYKTVNDIKQFIETEEVPCLIYANGIQSAQVLTNISEFIDNISGAVVCDPIASQSIKLDNETADQKIYFLNMNDFGEVEFCAANESIKKDKDVSLDLEGIRVNIDFIESCISSYPLINKNVVTVQTDKSGISKLVCFYIIAQNDIDEREIKQYLLQKLPWFGVPEIFVKVTEFPTNNEMIIDKSQLPNVFTSNMDDTMIIDEFIKKEALELLLEYCGREMNEEDLNKPIESLGLNSLLFIEYIVALEEKIGFEMPDNMLDIMVFKNMRHVLTYITSIAER